MAELEEKLGAILGNQDAMAQIVSIARAFSGGDAGKDAAPSGAEQVPEYEPVEQVQAENPLGMLGNLDPKLVGNAMLLFSEYSAVDDRKVALLEALKPFLKEARYGKMEQAVQIAKLSRVIRVAFQLFKGEGGDGDDV